MKATGIVLMAAMAFATCGSRSGERSGADSTAVEQLASAWDITIKGKVAYPQKGKILLTELRPDREGKKDSIILKPDNTFEKKVHITEPGYYSLNFFDKQLMNIILYRNNLTINVDGNAQEGKMEVIGSAEMDEIIAVQRMLAAQENSPEVVKLKEDFGKAQAANDAAQVNTIQVRYMELVKKSHDEVAAYLKQQPASLGTIEILRGGSVLTKDEYGDVYTDAAEKLKKAIPNSVFVKPFLDEIEKSRSTAIGSVAPEIALPDPTGKVLKLSSLRGQYVLVDFWAKWCGPCRRENPNVVKAFNQFKPKGFTVFGVSIDREKNDWVKAIAEDGLTWAHVLDVQSVASRDYGVASIPSSFLVDPKGVIVAKNLRGPALERKLEELLGK